MGGYGAFEDAADHLHSAPVAGCSVQGEAIDRRFGRLKKRLIGFPR